MMDGMGNSDLNLPLLQSTAEAIRVAHAYELSTDTSSTHPVSTRAISPSANIHFLVIF
jgi:hypothetical protein